MAQLPPKVPNIGTNWPEKKPCLMEVHMSSWADEFLDFSSVKRGSHRRSMSDSVAFLEIPMVEECRRASIPGSSTSTSTSVFDKFDDDQLIMSMFCDDINVVASGGPNLCSSNSSSPSDRNNMNDDDYDDGEDEKDEKYVPDSDMQVVHDQQMKSEPEEVESCCKSEGQIICTHNGYMENSKDKIVDPKRIKRILANRQSAQKSRVRKLQYVSELERVVTSLQAEVSVLSPRVAFLDHQRLVLGVDNSVLKQRIAAMGQDKIFKDAHQEALKREIERLRQVYYQQNMENNNTVENASLPDPMPQPSKLAINCSAEKEQLAN